MACTGTALPYLYLCFVLLEVSSRPYFASNNRCMGAEVTTYAGKTALDRPELKSRYCHEICLFFMTSRPVLGPAQPSVQWVRVFWGQPTHLFSGYGCSFPGINWQGREVDHSSPYFAEVKNECRCVTSHRFIRLHGARRNSRIFYRAVYVRVA